MARKVVARYRGRLAAVVLPALLISAWQVASSLGILDPSMVASPMDVAIGIGRSISDGSLQRSVCASALRVIEGFGIASVAGIVAGSALGWSRPVRRLVDPTLNFLRQIPPVAWIPVFILWFGIGEGSKVSVIAYASFFPVFLNSESAVADVGAEYLEVARVFRFTRSQTFLRVILPGSLGPIFTGLRLALGNSWRALVAAEMLAATQGLGYMIATARALVRPDEMFVGLIAIGALGLLSDWAMASLQRLASPWIET